MVNEKQFDKIIFLLGKMVESMEFQANAQKEINLSLKRILLNQTPKDKFGLYEPFVEIGSSGINEGGSTK